MAERWTRVRIERAGDYKVLGWERGDVVGPQGDEVLVGVEAIGVNYADCVVRMGLYASAKKYVGWPITPGFEVAGEVLAIGPDVSDVRVGQKVVAVTRFGGYTTHLTVPQRQVFALPEGFSVTEAAAFPSVFLTAYFGMFILGRPRRGERCLVHSAAGGVGGALLQLANVAGMEAVGVVGASHKVSTAEGFGASAVIDKSTEKLWPRAEQIAPEGYHWIFDANGVATLKQSFAHLAQPGRLVIYGFHTMLPRKGGRPNWLKLLWGYLRTPRFNPLDMTGDNRSVLAFNLSYLFDEVTLMQDAIAELWGWIAEGKLQAPRVTEYALSDVAQAHRDLESGQTVGKLVLVPGDMSEVA